MRVQRLIEQGTQECARCNALTYGIIRRAVNHRSSKLSPPIALSLSALHHILLSYTFITYLHHMYTFITYAAYAAYHTMFQEILWDLLFCTGRHDVVSHLQSLFYDYLMRLVGRSRE